MEVGAGFPVHHGGRLLRYRLRATGSSGCNDSNHDIIEVPVSMTSICLPGTSLCIDDATLFPLTGSSHRGCLQ